MAYFESTKKNGWKVLAENQAITQHLNYPESFDEILVIACDANSIVAVELIIPAALKNSGKSLRNGYFAAVATSLTVGNWNAMTIMAKLDTDIAFTFNRTGADTTAATYSAYYR